jgi:hypothetical protein
MYLAQWGFTVLMIRTMGKDIIKDFVKILDVLHQSKPMTLMVPTIITVTIMKAKSHCPIKITSFAAMGRFAVRGFPGIFIW